ncbi:Rap1-interacting factor 1 N terminal-domain-containing protein [Chaetomium sp. MPI-SDFR-AT-0129]|nr:Rap1-interacting factor 1 N terminal-domain-containing protein [Chaetomium sp. MPI-SDFR-AT-0129]
MSSPAVVSAFLSSLPPRPPTPPREAHHEAAASTRPQLGFIDTRVSVHTPPGFQSPDSFITTASTSRRLQKKVGFSARAEYRDAPVYPDGEAVKQHPTPVSLPRSASKPVKSILKVTTNTLNILDPTAGSGTNSPNPQINLIAMLDSTLQQLAGGDRGSKLDAYLMLTRAWKASNNLPDRVALQEKMSLFTQFMQRDISTRNMEGNPDVVLVNHALNLLNTFLHFPAISSTIPHDFGVFIIDHCIRSFEDSSTPKDTARRLMQVISLQKFPPKVMTADRVGRLVSSLHNIEEHLKGKSIVLSRALIYRKLIQQSRQLMVIHSDWLLDMFTDMLSNLKDIRLAAISLGLEAAFSIGHEKQLSRKAMEIFNLADTDRRYVQYYEERLRVMAKDRHESALVPEIWSVVILLLRVRLDKWEYAQPWLHIIQGCFNSPDFPTKIAANRAWSRLVYMMHLEERWSAKSLRTLATPLISQLKRRSPGKSSDDLRQAVLGAICNLFYYTFKPNTNAMLLDIYWDNSVQPAVAKLLDAAAGPVEDTVHQASAILGGLFDCTTPRRWKVDRVAELPFVSPGELPSLDSKWIRRNTDRVFGVVEPILEQDFLSLAKADSATCRLWTCLVSTVAAAAAKEIIVSEDTASFVAGSLGALQRVWDRGLSGRDETEGNIAAFLSSAMVYLEVLVRSLALPFTEKTGKQPSTPIKGPLYKLFSVLSTPPPGIPDDDKYAQLLRSVFSPFFASKGGKAGMDLAQDLMSTIPIDAPRPYGAWLLVAENISNWLAPDQNSHQSTGSGGETPVGHDYRDVVKLLERGIRSTPNLPASHWDALFHTAFERVREETGDAGAAIVLIEPLAKVVAEHCSTQGLIDGSFSGIKSMTELISVATQPRDRQAVDAARKRLWGTVLAGSRSSSFDTFDNLYRGLSEVLQSAYSNLSTVDSDSLVRLFGELGGFFDRCNRELFVRALVSVQGGFLLWVEDTQRRLGGQGDLVFPAVKTLWDKLAHLIKGIDHPEQQLQSLEDFLCASFASCHRSIVNSTIVLWNGMIENVEHVEYPEGLRAALVRMHPQADIAMLGLETPSVEENANQKTSFIDSFEDFSFPRLHSTRSSSRRSTPRPNEPQPKSPISTSLPQRSLDGSARGKLAVSTRDITTPRLRHDDSQVQFAAIMPAPASGSPFESQVLTERQKEIRERQRENAALFSDNRSSPDAALDDSEQQPLPVAPRERQAATPEPEMRFDDYVSSTPTPRRGQLFVMPEHDPTDPPSSPPEMRGNPLAAEIRSRSASHSLLEDWQFSSSPVSGSPNPHRHGVIPDPSSQRGYVSVVSLPEVLSSPAKAEDKTEPPPSTADDIIEDSMVFEAAEVVSNAKALVTPVEGSQGPFTPRRSSRLSQARARETPTPKSDGEEFVDAPTSPLPPTPGRLARQAQAQEQEQAPKLPGDDQAHNIQGTGTSFGVSDLDEASLVRLVVELDANTTDRSGYQRPSPSVSPESKKQPSPVIDCIVVSGSPEPEVALPARITRSTSTTSTTSSAGDCQDLVTPQRKMRSGRPKRKRAFSKAQDVSPKRRRHSSSGKTDAVLSSQTAVEVEGSAEVPLITVEGIPKKDENEVEERVPSSSAEPTGSEHSSQGAGPEESMTLQTGEAMDVEGDDQDVQSQIALEFSQHREEDDTPESEDASESPISFEEPENIHAESPVAQEQEMGDKIVEKVVNDEAANAAPTVGEQTTPETNQAMKIMDLFRGGLEELRSARLSREEVYRIEDMFMDMKRELYEAERRGRA